MKKFCVTDNGNEWREYNTQEDYEKDYDVIFSFDEKEAKEVVADILKVVGKQKVVIEVYQGVAEVTACPADVDVEIKDHD